MGLGTHVTMARVQSVCLGKEEAHSGGHRGMGYATATSTVPTTPDANIPRDWGSAPDAPGCGREGCWLAGGHRWRGGAWAQGALPRGQRATPSPCQVDNGSDQRWPQATLVSPPQHQDSFTPGKTGEGDGVLNRRSGESEALSIKQEVAEFLWVTSLTLSRGRGLAAKLSGKTTASLHT